MNAITVGMKNLALNLPRLVQGHWWVEVKTSDPICVYYFGPFPNSQEASEMRPGYVQDLIDEGAQNIDTVVKRCRPTELTQCHEED
jgi:Domain of unknown function (DUF1816)